jgi:4-amino-4-deoxy-L-arabinose transferase-like glycosyltransferase
VALVELWPASARPYIGGSTTNSVLQLIFGYNGLDRISSGGPGGGPGGGFSGAAGILRLFNSELGGQIGWLLPAAGIVLVAGAVWTARRARTDRARAALLLWGGWLVVSAAVYSFMTGVIHPYYTNTLAPPIAVLVGVGTVLLWRRRERREARLMLAAMLLATSVLSFLLLDRTPNWHPWLRFAILAAGLLAVAAILARRRMRPALATIGLVAALAGPAAYTLSAVATAETGSNPSAGPALASDRGFLSGRPPGVGGAPGSGDSVSRALAALLERDASRYTWVAATSSAESAGSLELATGKAVMGIGGFSGNDPAITLAHFKQLVAEHKVHYYVAGGGPGSGLRGGPGLPGAGGSGFQLRGGGPAGFGPPGGGFPTAPGLGGAPPGGGAPSGGARSVESQIQSWVSSHFKSLTVGGRTVYDLTATR